MPLWGGLASNEHAKLVLSNLFKPDMLTEWGFRSTSSSDHRYNNWNEIVPYSNWRGPIWLNANAILLYGCVHYGVDSAVAVAANVTRALADDLRRSGTWHECMSSESGHGLAAPGFL